MAYNRNLFGAAISRYNGKQLYKKFTTLIPISPRSCLDKIFIVDLKFYTVVLIMYVVKLKGFFILKDYNFEGTIKKIEHKIYEKEKEKR
jgi:hypothetical protein